MPDDGVTTNVIVPIAGGWRCTADVSWADGVPRVERITVDRPANAEPHGGLTQAELRKVPFRLIRQMAMVGHRKLSALGVREGTSDLARALPAVAQTNTKDNLLYYAMLAELYIGEAEVNSSPVKSLAETLKINTETLRKHLQRARRYGLLVAAAPGVPGGALTRKGRELIDGSRRH